MSIENIVRFFPSVEKFKTGLSFRQKIKWLLLFLSIYFFLHNIPLAGIGSYYYSQNPLLILYSTLTGAKTGTLATLGVAPMVTASIIVQLLVASKILNWNIKEIEGRRKSKALEVLLTYFFIIVESIIFTLYSKYLLPVLPGNELIVFIQMVIGGILIYFICSAIDKIGFGSGITLIILAGISSSFFISLFSPFTISKDGNYIFWFQEEDSYPIGRVISLFVAMSRNDYDVFMMNFIPLFFTFVLIFVIILIFRSVIEIPLIHFQFKGFGKPIEFSLFYASTLPLILGSAFLANLNLVFSTMATTYKEDLRCGIFGCFDNNNNAISGIAYYLSPPRALVLEFFGIRVIPDEITIKKEFIKTIIFFLFFTMILVIFSWIWTYSAGMDPQSIAESLSYYGFGISGYRVDERIIQDVLNRYIPYLTILSGILASIIAVTIDIFGGILVSTSLLILVSGSYSYYLLLKGEKSEDIPTFIKKFLE